MSDHESKITIRPVDGRYVVRAGGAVIADTWRALEFVEEGLEPVLYFPREDVGTVFLERSITVASTPRQGLATYYGIAAKSGLIPDAAWSYEDPLAPAVAIAGYLAFDPSKATIEET